MLILGLALIKVHVHLRLSQLGIGFSRIRKTHICNIKSSKKIDSENLCLHGKASYTSPSLGHVCVLFIRVLCLTLYFFVRKNIER